MKESLLPALLLLLASCGNADNSNTTSNALDSVDNKTSASPDTVRHPSGVDNSSVISTDTAAMNIQNTYKKTDTAKQ